MITRRRAALALLAASMLLLAAPAATARGQAAPPGDREIRAFRESNVAVTTLTLMLRSGGVALAINLVLTGRRDVLRPDAPVALAMDFHLPVYAGPMNFDKPHYELRVTTSADALTLVQGSLENRLAMAHVSLVQVPFDIVRLSQLAGARAAAGRLFGVEFVLSQDQIAAVGEFAERVIKN